MDLCFQIQANLLGMYLKETTEGVGKDDLWVIYKGAQLQTICASEETRIKLNTQQQGNGYTNKLWYIHKIEYSAVFKNNFVEVYLLTLKNAHEIQLSEKTFVQYDSIFSI